MLHNLNINFLKTVNSYNLKNYNKSYLFPTPITESSIWVVYASANGTFYQVSVQPGQRWCVFTSVNSCREPMLTWSTVSERGRITWTTCPTYYWILRFVNFFKLLALKVQSKLTIFNSNLLCCTKNYCVLIQCKVYSMLNNAFYLKQLSY